MALIILLDFVYRGPSPFEGVKSKHTFTDRYHIREAGVLNNDRPAGRKVTGRPAAKPSSLSLDIAVFRHAPLRFRGLDIRSVTVQIGAYAGGINYPPSRSDEQLPRRLEFRWRTIHACGCLFHQFPVDVMRAVKSYFKHGRLHLFR
jgi:hypothetical protein